MKKLIACLILSAMVCGTIASCGDSESSSVESSSESATEAATEAPTEAEEESESESAPQAVETEDIEFEDAVVAESGDAYLAIVDSQWWIQYWGTDEHPLTYNAGVVPITGNGDYTVSVTTDTNGYRFDTTGDANDSGAVASGLQFLAVMIKDGEELFPGAVITVNSVKVNGSEIPMSTKAYTSSDDGKETRCNLYNQWVSEPSADGRSVDGLLYGEDGETAADFLGDYSAQSISPDDFADGWTDVVVDFTVSGIAE